MQLDDTEDDEGFVVEAFAVALEVLDFGEDGFDGFFGGQVVVAGDGVGEAVTEGFLGIIFGVGDAVAEEVDGVAGAHGEADFFVLGLGEHAEGEAFDADGFDFALAAEDGLNGAGVCDLEGEVLVVPDGVEHGDVLGIKAALVE